MSQRFDILPFVSALTCTLYRSKISKAGFYVNSQLLILDLAKFLPQNWNENEITTNNVNHPSILARNFKCIILNFLM